MNRRDIEQAVDQEIARGAVPPTQPAPPPWETPEEMVERLYPTPPGASWQEAPLSEIPAPRTRRSLPAPRIEEIVHDLPREETTSEQLTQPWQRSLASCLHRCTQTASLAAAAEIRDKPRSRSLSMEQVREAYEASGRNISATARKLNLPRTTMREILAKMDAEPKAALIEKIRATYEATGSIKATSRAFNLSPRTVTRWLNVDET